MTTSRVVLVTAASGHIGESLVPLLATDPTIKLILPTSDASRLRSKFANQQQWHQGNVVIEEGSVKNPSWFQELLTAHRVDTVFLNLTGEDELFTTMNCLDCMSRSSSVKKLIYVSACMDFDSTEGIRHYLGHCSAAHVLVKALVEQKLIHGNLAFEWTVLRPTLFFINDLRSKESMIERAIFDEPLGEAGVSRVAPWDIALAATNLVSDRTQKWNNKQIAIGSRKAYRGSEITKIWSSALGKQITMPAADEEGLQRYEEEFGARIGDKAGVAWGRDLRLMYETFATQGFGMTEEAYRQQLELLGQEPAKYEEWVQATAYSWT